MSTFTRPRHRFNRQICENIKINLGKNAYGLANQKPNNPIDFTLANLARGISFGAFMKQTPTGTALPNPITDLKKFAKGSGGGKNPPEPKFATGNNTFTLQGNQNNYMNNAVRREARQQVRQEIQGRIAVTPRPNVIRRELAAQAAYHGSMRRANSAVARLRGEEQQIERDYQPAPPNEQPPPAALRRAIITQSEDAPRRVRRGLGMTDVEEAAFTFEEYVPTPSRAGETPATSVQPAGQLQRRGGRRRTLFLEDVKDTKVSSPDDRD